MHLLNVCWAYLAGCLSTLSNLCRNWYWQRTQTNLNWSPTLGFFGCQLLLRLFVSDILTYWEKSIKKLPWVEYFWSNAIFWGGNEIFFNENAFILHNATQLNLAVGVCPVILFPDVQFPDGIFPSIYGIPGVSFPDALNPFVLFPINKLSLNSSHSVWTF